MAHSTASIPARSGFARQLTLMAVVGTLLPLAVLALLYLLAPMPLTATAAATLRAANGVAAVVVGLNAAAVTTLALARALFSRKLPTRVEWQPVRVVRTARA